MTEPGNEMTADAGGCDRLLVCREPGVLAWHTPAGRTCTTTPTQYAI